MGRARSEHTLRTGLTRVIAALGGRATVTRRQHLMVYGPNGTITVAPSTLDGSPRGVRNVAAQLRRVGIPVTNDQVRSL